MTPGSFAYQVRARYVSLSAQFGCVDDRILEQLGEADTARFCGRDELAAALEKSAHDLVMQLEKAIPTVARLVDVPKQKGRAQ